MMVCKIEDLKKEIINEHNKERFKRLQSKQKERKVSTKMFSPRNNEQDVPSEDFDDQDFGPEITSSEQLYLFLTSKASNKKLIDSL